MKRAPASAPGATLTYSNANYTVLGLLIEKLTGVTVQQAVAIRIIEPLGLTGTSFPASGDRSLPAPAVRGYHGVRIGGFFFWSNVVRYDPSAFSSSGAMISTQQDLTAFFQALIGGRLISSATLAEMEKAVEPGGPTAGLGYGLGLVRRDLPCGGVSWGRNGIVPGYFTQTLVTADGRHASVVTNAHFTINTPAEQMDKLLTTALCEKS
ncbi:MAG TPA: serine hydrolase domain-containing protein [Streptomyces sp.]|nr:serine hydrolase domain-containing protein [Streptomyces sp.]